MLVIANGGMNINNIRDTRDAIMLTKKASFVDGVKIDIWKSLDNQLVVCLDDDLTKTTLSNKKIHECNYAEIKKVKFPSHIFKYYLPLLEDIIKDYDCDKKIVLDIHVYNNEVRKMAILLKEILLKYPHRNYAFISDNDNLLKELEKEEMNQIGKIYYNTYIYCDDNLEILDEIDDNYLIITNNPFKITKYLQNMTK